MPFTPSHAVVALPFVRTPIVPAAIAVGAMTPDLPLFVRAVVPDYGTTHDVRMLPLTMLIALVLLLAWRLLLRPATRIVLPRPIAERLPVAWDGGIRAGWRETFPSVVGVLWLLVALGLGVLSHILWDSLTHEGRGGVQLLPVLGEPWGPLPGYKWLQYGSGVLGLAGIAIFALVWLTRRTPSPVAHPAPRIVFWLWLAALPVALGIATAIGLAAFVPLDAEFTIAHLAYRVLPPACAVWGAATFVLCLVLPQRWRVTTR
ncbi:hypothetical protein GCM10025768_27870 [Microbacterium pseudoresistens]|uniref:Cell wall anchor protein n=1 Tax=Microbacterium pseudoresistens TaxID=640634 RepID=A0A7Y9JLG3_9MICO|nr:DUF4184 family protein [Microbacterium pseudoresistens]NYD53677.1 hypothetical protein [Microbacterium pseudoresistens]